MVALVLPATLVPGPAYAGEVLKPDAAGDARPIYDIWNVGLRNDTEALTIGLELWRLRRWASYQAEFAFNTPAMAKRDWVFRVRALRRPDGRRGAMLFLGRTFSDTAERIPCRITTAWKFRDNVVVIRVPQRCLRNWVGRQRVIGGIGPIGRSFEDRTRMRAVVYN